MVRTYPKCRLDSTPFAAWLHKIMERDDLSIKDAAFRLGIGDKTMREILHGRRDVELDTVDRALIAAGVHLREVYPDWYAEAA